MERLWSPWRSAYIESFRGTEKPACIFCNKINENIEDENSLIVYKDKLTFTVLNLYPYNNGHLMIVPYRHTSDFQSLTINEQLEVMKNLQFAQKALIGIYNPDGFNVGANFGKVAGAGIDNHIHFHIVPRWSGDSNFMPVLGEVKVISQDLMITKKELITEYRKIISI